MTSQRLISELFVIGTLFAQPEERVSGTITSLSEKLIIAAVSAVLSLLGGYILLQMKERREAQKRLSYDLAVRYVLGVDDVIAKDIDITYKNRPASQIIFVSCDVQNIGNRVVKEQFLRFAFGESGTVLDSYLDPQPPREFGVAEVADDGLPAHERKFVIKHLERDQRVGFRFIVSGIIESDVKVYPHNESGDVEVLLGTVRKTRDDRATFEKFIVFFLIGSIVPPIFYQIPDEIGDLAGFLVSSLIALVLLPLLRPTARVIASGIANLGRGTGAQTVTFNDLHQEQSSELTIAIGTTSSIIRSAHETSGATDRVELGRLVR